MSYVYFIRAADNDLFKIGYSSQIEKRLKMLQTHFPYPLRVFACIESETPNPLEKELHREFSIYRLNGEWFAITEKQVLDCVERHSKIPEGFLIVNSEKYKFIYRVVDEKVFIALNVIPRNTHRASLFFLNNAVIIGNIAAVDTDVFLKVCKDNKNPIYETIDLVIETAYKHLDSLKKEHTNE